MRLRDLGLAIGDLPPGPENAITDVGGVRVGHTTLIQGEGALEVGRGPVRTGVTVILPSDDVGEESLFAGFHRLNGNGELTGLQWIRESGLLTTPVAITNTHSVGVVHDALIEWKVRQREPGEIYWSLPVVGETWDGTLSDVGGMHVRPEHIWAAVEGASGGPVSEGNVGGGTGMICHGFKGGVGTASRRLAGEAGGWTVGVLVQADHGARRRLSVDGVPIGREIPESEVPVPRPPTSPAPPGAGSIIVVVATDAPLLPDQCERLAQRAALGIARTGGAGENSSGDMALCFATGNRGVPADLWPWQRMEPGPIGISMIPHHAINPLFYATIEATEEAIVNALLQAQTMTGRDGITAHRLDPDRLLEVMSKYGRGPGSN